MSCFVKVILFIQFHGHSSFFLVIFPPLVWMISCLFVVIARFLIFLDVSTYIPALTDVCVDEQEKVSTNVEKP
jgi:hypothetical protein